jgi:putative endonuclease
MAAEDKGRRRRRAERYGRLSEFVAAAFLVVKGYRILALRYRTPMGEIDIIARKGDLVIFVEVKARARLVDAVDAVSIATQQRIRNASDLWLARRRDAHRLSQRYDIVTVQPWRLPVHFPDAF